MKLSGLIKNSTGRRCFGFNSYRSADFDFIEPVEREVLSDDIKTVKDSLLDSIFSIDVRTKLPSGDISVFLSENTSDSVKKFIQDNLLSDNGGVSDTSKYDGLSDDIIAKYMRNHDESIYQYRDRMLSVLRENYAEYKKSDSIKE